MPNQLESRYRDFLATNLDLIEPGLSLVKAEMLLPNEQGAKGFVDLVARDRFGVLVLVEIKRSDSAARSAMHELFKYMALFRHNHGLDTHQVRCVLLSTTWHELLVPFSDLLASAPFELSGRELEIGNAGEPIGSRLVEPVDISSAIAICPKHEILLYLSPDERAADIGRVCAALSEAGVTDYYLIHMDHDGTNPHVVTPHSLYVVLGELSAAQRSEVQKTRDQFWRDETLEEEGNEQDIPEPGDEDYEEMDGSSWEHEEHVFIWMNAASRNATLEIGYPDKLRKALESWPTIGFTRSGRFTSELVWPDEALLAGAISAGGEYTTVFTSQVSTANEAAFTRLLTNIDYSLMGAQGWREQIPRLLKHLRSETSTAAISVDIFSPCDLLWGLSALPDGKFGYLPAFEIVTESPDSGARIFVGALEWDQETTLSPSIGVDQVVEGGASQYHLSHHFGTQWEDEDRYCKFHGLRYAIYEFGSGDMDQRFWRVRVESSGIEHQETSLGQLRAGSIFAFAEQNAPYLENLSDQLIKTYASTNPL